MKSFPRILSHVGLYLFAFSIPVSFVPAEFGIGFALLGWLGEGVFNKRWAAQWHPFFVPLIFYLAWNLISSLLSPRPLHSLWAWTDNEWPVCIMLMLFWVVDKRETLKNLVTTFLATSSIAMLYGIWQTFFGLELWRGITLHPMGSLYRSVGFNGFYLTFAAFAMTVFFISASLWIETKDKNRWMFALAAVLSFLAVIGSFARSIWLSFLFAVPSFGFLRGKRAGLLLTSGFFIIVFSFLALMPDIRHRALSIFDLGGNETRLNLWRTSVRIAADHPILGIGEDNFDYYFERYKVEGFYDATGHPHNDYLTVLVQSGFPGLVAFVSMWIIAIRSGRKGWSDSSDNHMKAIMAGGMLSILGFLVGSLFQNYYGTFANCLGWWFITGLLFVAMKLESHQQQST